MVELYETSAAGARLPLEIGTVSVREVQAPLYLLAPYKGQAAQAASAFNTQLGLEWPGPNELKRKGGSMRSGLITHILLWRAQRRLAA